MATTRAQIDEFLSHKRFAVIGVSRDPKDFTRSLFSELRRREYDVVPVNPAVSEVDGVPCYANVQDITPPVKAALVLTPSAASSGVVRDCDAAGVRSVWLYRAAGAGAVSPAAIDFCEARSIAVVAGECPFMFLPDTQWFHRAHGFCRRILGRYPR